MATARRRPKSNARVPQQSRSEDAIARIAKAVVSLLASEGQSALTHRRVAEVAGVSLATTTYYYASKFDLIADAQTRFLAGYADAFVHAKERHRTGESPIADLADLMLKAMKNAVRRHGLDTLAWSEIMLDCARDERGHALAREWFGRMEKLWADLLVEIGTPDAAKLVNPAIDVVAGMGFITIPLQLTVEQIDMLLVDGLPLATVCGELPDFSMDGSPGGGNLSSKSRETRDRIIGAAVAMLEAGEASTISYSAVAQRAGLTSAAPSYHFPTVSQLLGYVNHELLCRMGQRRARILSTAGPENAGATAADALATIYVRRVIEQGTANIAGFQASLDAARRPELRAQFIKTILILEEEFTGFLKAWGIPALPRFPLILLAQFIGKYVRALATGSTTEYLARARSEFECTLSLLRGSDNPLLRRAPES